MQNFVILTLSLLSVASLAALPHFREWFRGILAFPFSALLLFLLFIGVFFLGGSRTADTELLDPLRFARVLLFTGITGCAWLSIILGMGRKNAARINGAVWAMLAYGSLAMVTAIYSVQPALTMWKGFEVVTHVSVAAVLSRQATTIESTQKIIGLMWIFVVFVAVSLLWGAALYPGEAFNTVTGQAMEYGESGLKALRGLIPKLNPNTATQIGGMLALAAFSYLVVPVRSRARWPFVAVLLAGLAVLLLARSRTSMGATILAVGIIAIYTESRNAKVLLGASAFVLVAFAAVSESVIQFFMRGQTIEQIEGFSGRAASWVHVWDTFMESPIIGYGYYAAQRVLFHSSTTENTYLGVLLGGGVILFSVFVIPIAIIATQLFRTRLMTLKKPTDTAYRVLWVQMVSLFTILIVRSVTGTSFDGNHPNLVFFLICSIGASALIRFRANLPESQRSSQAQMKPSDGGGASRLPLRQARRVPRISKS